MINDKAADRTSIAEHFGTDGTTTDRILQNLSWGFFTANFGEDAQKMWDEAHPFMCYSQPSAKDYSAISITFIEKHFDLFSKKQLWIRSGWRFDPKTDWVVESGYKTV